nr:MAG TPA: hypothetical protein [Caudoviricetes sp.]
MVKMESIIKSLVDEGRSYIGSINGVPYFIDDSACPFAKDNVYRYNALSEYRTDILIVDDIKDTTLREMAEKAIYLRDTTNKPYIEFLHSMGDKTFTEERREKAARNRTA